MIVALSFSLVARYFLVSCCGVGALGATLGAMMAVSFGVAGFGSIHSNFRPWSVVESAITLGAAGFFYPITMAYVLYYTAVGGIPE